MVPTETTRARFPGTRMLKPLLANVLLAFLLTMPGCGKNELPDAPSASFVRVGSPAPEIQGVDLDGKTFNLSDYRGKVVDLSFWASWCPPCRALFPHEKAIVEKYKDRPFVLIGVNGDQTREAGAAAALKFELPWRSFWNDESRPMPITNAYRLEGWPTSFIIDANGIVRDRLQGYDPEGVAAAIEKIVAETERPKSGR
jgi:thiol-disulfide isomerase/thioredoxin